ncbi:MAG: response regulator [Methermicoccaceae archaeon]
MSTKVLVADDDELLRDLLRELLSAFEVVEAEDGKEAVEVFETHRPDVVLMDINMPVMDGIAATKEILKIEPDATVLAFTAFSARGREMLDVGAKEVLKKPMRGAQLVEIINKYTS